MTISIHSSYTNYTYSLNIFVPEADKPQEGFPVIYVLDGLSYFDYARKTIELQSKNSKKTQVSPAIIVGVNHEINTMKSRRFYDFTAPSASYRYPDRMRNNIPAAVGGAVDFHRFIEYELKPIVRRNFKVDTDNETLFGHSLGGYYALWSLFNRSESFANYIAISPSIWWNDYELLSLAEKFVENGSTCRSLFLAAGELEGFMADDARTMHKLLCNQSFPVTFYEALEENHASVVPTVISRSFRYISSHGLSL